MSHNINNNIDIKNNQSRKTLRLSIVSTEGEIYSNNVYELFAMGIAGELGIYPGHLQLLTYLKPGNIRFLTLDLNYEVIYVSGGIFEVQPNSVNILADLALRATDIDEAEARKSQQEAEKILQQKPLSEAERVSYHEAKLKNLQALAKLQAILALKKYKYKS